MRILYELSWLWEMLEIALVASAISIACAFLICKATNKRLSKKIILIVGIAAFVLAIVAAFGLSYSIMPL